MLNIIPSPFKKGEGESLWKEKHEWLNGSSLKGFAPEPPVVFVILSEAKYFLLCSFGLTPHPTPLPQGAREKNI